MNKKNVNVSVVSRSSYVAAQSDPINHKFLWSYEITIKNESDEIVQLLNRRWIITDKSGKVESIQGAGVIGLQPLIKPGKEFSYTSYCQLVTPQGTMEGTYEMQTLEEQHFNVDIPKFILSAPSSVTQSFRSLLH
jgi:ApaG protein